MMPPRTAGARGDAEARRAANESFRQCSRRLPRDRWRSPPVHATRALDRRQHRAAPTSAVTGAGRSRTTHRRQTPRRVTRCSWTDPDHGRARALARCACRGRGVPPETTSASAEAGQPAARPHGTSQSTNWPGGIRHKADHPAASATGAPPSAQPRGRRARGRRNGRRRASARPQPRSAILRADALLGHHQRHSGAARKHRERSRWRRRISLRSPARDSCWRCADRDERLLSRASRAPIHVAQASTSGGALTPAARRTLVRIAPLTRAAPNALHALNRLGRFRFDDDDGCRAIVAAGLTTRRSQEKRSPRRGWAAARRLAIAAGAAGGSRTVFASGAGARPAPGGVHSPAETARHTAGNGAPASPALSRAACQIRAVAGYSAPPNDHSRQAIPPARCGTGRSVARLLAPQPTAPFATLNPATTRSKRAGRSTRFSAARVVTCAGSRL